ncbi:SDR family oxidoreductase [Mucilaginibacter sp.]|jgi:uncharacterized oxidoreductase|uniref:SDR family oxidoreductase n=1 Tax=Mucilaginibacter sp. TaxID=1882438 RepID=UPI00356A0045
MNISKKTVLITGGGSGIGHETAKLLSAKGNKVLIIGRNGGKLERAANGLPGVSTFEADITKKEDVIRLIEKIKTDYADLSVVINNAAAANVYKHSNESDSFEKASEEINTNYLSVIRLNEALLPLLKSRQEAAIVNVTSLVAFAPVTVIPTYSDTKAALHSYTLTLRHTLAIDSSIKVFELMPPLVNTEFSKEIGGEANGMPSHEVAQALVDGIENDVFEIHVGQTKDFREFFFSNPAEAFATLNQA